MRIFVVFVVCCMIATTSWAIEQLQLTIDHWQSEAIQLDNLDLNVSYTAQGISFTATADELMVPPPIEKLTALRLDCKAMQFFDGQLQCQRGRLQFEQKDLGSQQIDFTIKTDPRRQSHHVMTSGLSLAGANINLSLNLNPAGWKVKADSDDIEILSLRRLIQPYLTKLQQQALLNGQQAGSVSVALEANGVQQQLKQLGLKSQIKQLTLSDELGQFVTEDLQANWAVKLTQQQQVWQWQIDLALEQGQAYIDPIFLDLMATPMSLKAKGNWYPKNNTLEVVNSEINHHMVGTAVVSLTMKNEHVHQLKLDIAKTALAPIYHIGYSLLRSARQQRIC